jgi:hypothetical protein
MILTFISAEHDQTRFNDGLEVMEDSANTVWSLGYEDVLRSSLHPIIFEVENGSCLEVDNSLVVVMYFPNSGFSGPRSSPG